MHNPYESPSAPLDLAGVDQKPRPRFQVVLSFLCCGVGVLLMVDFCLTLVQDLSRYPTVIAKHGLMHRYAETMIVQNVGTLLCGGLGLASGRFFWVGRRVPALVCVLLGVLTLSICARIVAVVNG